MSCYETHKGVLKKVDTDNTRQYQLSEDKQSELCIYPLQYAYIYVRIQMQASWYKCCHSK